MENTKLSGWPQTFERSYTFMEVKLNLSLGSIQAFKSTQFNSC